VRGSPLGQPVDFAFKAGLWWDEEVWLRGRFGGLTKVTGWSDEGDGTQIHGTTGYQVDGRFTPPLFDHSGTHLVFAERLAFDGEGQPWRLVAYNIATGRAEISAPVARFGLTVGAGYGVTVALALQEGTLRLYELSQGSFEEVASVGSGDGGDPTSWTMGSPTYLRSFDGDPVLLASQAAAWRKVGGEWTVWPEMEGERISSLGASPDGLDLCLYDRTTEVARLLRPGGTVEVLLREGGQHGGCGWSPDGSMLYFQSWEGESYDVRVPSLRLFERDGEPKGRIEGLRLLGSWRGRGVGESGEQLVTFDWASREMEPLLSMSELTFAPAPGSGYEPEWVGRPHILLPPDDYALALVKVRFQTIDSDHSGAYLLDLETGSTLVVEEPLEHGLMHYSIGAGGALYATAPHAELYRWGNGKEGQCPATLWRFGPVGARQVVSFFSGSQAVLHTPVFPDSNVLPETRVFPPGGVY